MSYIVGDEKITPLEIIGSVDTPVIPLNSTLEATLLPNDEKVAKA